MVATNHQSFDPEISEIGDQKEEDALRKLFADFDEGSLPIRSKKVRPDHDGYEEPFTPDTYLPEESVSIMPNTLFDWDHFVKASLM